MRHRAESDSKGLIVRPVEGRKDLDLFISLPWKLYRDDPNWVPPLKLERRLFLSRSSPYFKHAEAMFWLAFRGRRVVGRISAQVDRLFLDRYGEETGFWGMLEAEDDEELFASLLDTAAGWLKGRGMKKMRGPFNLSINQECGLLIKGFHHPPAMMMGHARPYYQHRVEALGHEKARDLLAYQILKSEDAVERIQAILGTGRGNFSSRALDRSRLEEELHTIFAIFNDAWSHNWGFVPFTRDEYLELGKSMSHLARPEFIRIAEVDGEPAGFIAVLPDLNEIIRDLDGRLFPLGWAKLLWRLKFHDFEGGRVLLMGVLRKYQDSLAGAAISLGLIRDVMNRLLESSIHRLELSWILEDNLAMRRIIEALGAEPYKIYRIYEKEIL